jgi:hypothetical protein
MYITIAGEHYPCTNASPGADGIVYSGVEGLSAAPTSGVISVCTDDGFELRADDVGAYKRQVLDGSTLTLTDTPAPTPPTADELLAAARTAALGRVEGKCSAAIYAGVDVGGVRYTLSEHEQAALSIAQSKVDKGATSVIYGDGLKDAATITAISAAAYEWGVICTTYYAFLKKYIGNEKDVKNLSAVRFGMELPSAYDAAFLKMMSGAGIDASKYKDELINGKE